MYLRFGKIPINEKSKIYNGELFVGHEKGVSVYACVKIEGEYKLIFPNITASACVSLSGVLERQCYLVDGKRIGTGSDGEPLIININIIKLL